MKKNLLFIIVIVVLTIFSSCDSKTSTSTEESVPSHEPVTHESQITMEPEIPVTTDPIVKLSETDVDLKIDDKPDRYGNYWAEYRFKNNSEYPIVHFEVLFCTEENLDPLSASIKVTTKPGELSAVAFFQAEKNVTIKSMKYIVFKDEKYYKIAYDVDTKTYTNETDFYYDVIAVPNDKVSVLSDFEISYKTDPPNNTGDIYSEVSVINKTSHVVKDMIIYTVSPKTGKLFTFGKSTDKMKPLEPNGEAIVFRSFGAEELVPVKIIYWVEVDGKTQIITYDMVIDRYLVEME